MNSQNGEFHEVGLVTSTSTTIDNTIHFLGNTIIPPVITGAEVSFTLNNVVEFNGQTFDTAELNMHGFDIALWEISTL